jgi:hypothetical protein
MRSVGSSFGDVWPLSGSYNTGRCLANDIFMCGNTEIFYLCNALRGYDCIMDGLSSNLRRRPLQVAVAGLLSELGYDNAENMALETLIEMVQSSKFISSVFCCAKLRSLCIIKQHCSAGGEWPVCRANPNAMRGRSVPGLCLELKHSYCLVNHKPNLCSYYFQLYNPPPPTHTHYMQLRTTQGCVVIR